MIQFGMNFYIWYEVGVQLILFNVAIQLSQHCLLKRLLSPH